MDATTTPSTDSLISQLAADFPDIAFKSKDTFEWDASTATVLYDPTDTLYAERTLHEVSHAALKHTSYDKDIDLIAMEREAWQLAKTSLGPKYNVNIAADVIEDDLDTYRDWLHARSTCPSCEATGIQVKKQGYRCVSCQASWRVNEARICALRRHLTQ